jgi:hypothetical protein
VLIRSRSWFAGLAALVLLTVSACGPVSPWRDDGRAVRSLDRDPLSAADGEGPRYDEIRQKSVHNAYQREQRVYDQLAHHGVRSLELDLHVGKLGRASRPGDWFVYHVDFIDRGTSCAQASDCLDEIARFRREQPDHEVLTVFLDVKDDFEPGGHDAADLDRRILAHVGRDALFTPADLLASCPGARTLRQAVTGECRWPRVEEMRGKILVALTGGGACSADDRLRVYAGRSDGDAGASAGTPAALAFIAPTIGSRCSWSAFEGGLPNAVFVNVPPQNRTEAGKASDLGLIARVWGLNDPTAWDQAAGAMANFLATDAVDAEKDPWASTRSPSGSPFTCLGACGNTGHRVAISRAASAGEPPTVPQ